MRNLIQNGIQFTKVIFAIMSLGTFTLSACNGKLRCDAEEKFRAQTIDGKVLRKFLDRQNHMLRTIKLDNGPDIILIEDTTAFFNFLIPGDNVNKVNGDGKIYIKKGALKKGFLIYFNCQTN